MLLTCESASWDKEGTALGVNGDKELGRMYSGCRAITSEACMEKVCNNMRHEDKTARKF